MHKRARHWLYSRYSAPVMWLFTYGCSHICIYTMHAVAVTLVRSAFTVATRYHATALHAVLLMMTIDLYGKINSVVSGTLRSDPRVKYTPHMNVVFVIGTHLQNGLNGAGRRKSLIDPRRKY